ncbi:MAG: outer membrane lipoprotein-sorting protein [Candidatus Dadabacteria bacterium]|nr:MAG: outer membrane lipoprotein-sorting protein [Candidatus Dadabacteria bacterium]
MCFKEYAISVFFIIYLLPSLLRADTPRAAELVREAIDYWRDKSSYSEAEMIIHRPDWERRLELKMWTRGSDLSLVRFTAPAKDAGNANLKRGSEMWSYSPKINRIIKIPSSMMHQSWMGSDFSYNDLAKADEIVRDYDHTLVKTEKLDGLKVYTVESVPHEDAPVVWGKELLKIREDKIILEHLYFDQDMKLIKKLEASQIRMAGGKLYPMVILMTNVEKPEHWTKVTHKEVVFNLEIPDRYFTLSFLRNPR